MPRYHLEVIQHPIRARMCGFGEKDRRPIDPPPVVQLFVTKEDGTTESLSSPELSLFYVVHCDLWSADQIDERNLVINPASLPTPMPVTNNIPGGPTSSVISLNEPSSTRNLMGSVISNAYQLTNDKGDLGIYFVFQDLSVRTEGRFCLRFMFTPLIVGYVCFGIRALWLTWEKNMRSGCGGGVGVGGGGREVGGLINVMGMCFNHVRRAFDTKNVNSRVEAEVYTHPFTVYSAKKFPGMTESTELSKCFARQGIKIPIRKEKGYKRPTDSLYRSNASGSSVSSVGSLDKGKGKAYEGSTSAVLEHDGADDDDEEGIEEE
ncbi:velvet factor [Jimgerdemannia flammicorona]|uniref:Velvet factor n=1 Tax=Jimgerdemannia flammicorona TaxID=994334 RepID=A0A433CXM0_9FUNG|nr:velvet factor [Jimgerdemannia flammicorona]